MTAKPVQREAEEVESGNNEFTELIEEDVMRWKKKGTGKGERKGLLAFE